MMAKNETRFFAALALVSICSIGISIQTLLNTALNTSENKNLSNTVVIDDDGSQLDLGRHGQGQIKPKDILDELDILSTGGLETKSLECPHPLVKFQNVIVRNNNLNSTSTEQQKLKIPKILHVSMKSRCMPRDLAKTLERWQEVLPNYSIFFHDDDAVARLIAEEWHEFPGLQRAMRCVFFKGAMKIDVWRILILYKYGGVYSDIDNYPLSDFDERTIRSDLSAFFFSDPWNRPSQWFMAAEPRHPLMYLTLRQIIKNVMGIGNILRPKVVFTTGPMALKGGYDMFLSSPVRSSNHSLTIDRYENDVEINGLFGKSVLKHRLPKRKGKEVIAIKYKYDEIVPFNSTLNVTRSERIEMDSGMQHWTKVEWNRYKTMRGSVKQMSCEDYLKKVDEESIEEFKPV